MTIDVASPGHHCIAVYKTTPADLPKEGRGLLHIAYGLTDVPDEPSTPAATKLTGAWPNPFNPRTTIVFELAVATEARLTIVDLQGRRVRTLASAPLPAGRHEIVWDGRDDAGHPLPSGAYMAQLSAGNVRQMKKMLLVK